MNAGNKQFIEIVKKKLDKYEVKPTSNFDIMKVIPDIKIITYAELNGCTRFPFDESNRLVIFYDLGSKVGHWVCVMYYPETDTASWFDSYGLKVDSVLSDMPRKELIKLGEAGNNARNCMRSYSNAEFNPYRFQALEDAQTCGKHVCVRLIMQELGVREYANWMKTLSKTTGLSPDELVCVLIKSPELLKNNESV